MSNFSHLLEQAQHRDGFALVIGHLDARHEASLSIHSGRGGVTYSIRAPHHWASLALGPLGRRRLAMAMGLMDEGVDIEQMRRAMQTSTLSQWLERGVEVGEVAEMALRAGRRVTLWVPDVHELGRGVELGEHVCTGRRGTGTDVVFDDAEQALSWLERTEVLA